MARYTISAQAYYRDLIRFYAGHPAGGAAPETIENSRVRYGKMCQRAIAELVDHYALAGKNVISIGAGGGHEEFHLWRAGCQLTLLDNAPGNEEFVSALPPADKQDALRYYCEDLQYFLDNTPEDLHDLCYISSFHPDEFRRGDVQEAFRAANPPGTFEDQPYKSWPDDAEPFADYIMACVKVIAPDGLFICQSYCNGVDVINNPHFIDLIGAQFRRHGLELLEVHYFRKSPVHILVASIKANRKRAMLFSQRLRCNPQITTFHGRYDYEDIKTDVRLAFALDDEPGRPVGRPTGNIFKWLSRFARS
jgi:hypothetical protein